MKRLALIVLALVVALSAAGLVAAQFYLSGDALRTRIEAAVLKATGRALKIAGPVRLGWSLAPAIEASDVSLANPPGFSRPAMAHVDRIEARVGLLALLSRHIEVNGLTLAGPDVLLERDANGRANWDFTRPVPAQAAAAASTSGGPRFSVDVGEVTLEGAKLGLRGAQTVEVAAPHVTYDPRSGRVAGDLVFRSTALHVAGTVIAPGGAVAADLHVEGGGLTLALSGTTAASHVAADVADLSSLSVLTGAKLPALRNVHVETTAKLAPTSLELDGLKLTSAQGDLAGTLIFASTPRRSVRGALSSTRLDLDALTPPAAPAPAGPAAAPAAPAPPDRVIPDTPIPYAALRAADADLQLNAAALSWRGKTYPGIVAHVALKDGALRLDPAQMTLAGKTLSAQLQADAATQSVGAKLDAPGLPAGSLSAWFGGPAGAAGTVDLHADLRGQGATWHAAAATLQGNAGVAMVDGVIDNAWLLDKLQDTLRAANLPIDPGGDSKVRCLALSAEAAGGKVQVQALTLDTSKLQLEGTGEIDLASETLDLHLRPTLRLGAALSVPIHVGGTLRTPKLVLDSGALAPGRVGISIGGKSPSDPCGPALTLARGGQPGPLPTTPEPATRPLKPADLLRGLLR